MFDYNKYYPSEKDFPTDQIEEIIVKHDLMASTDLINLARACWAECNIHLSKKVYRVRLERTEIAEVYVKANSAEEAGELAKEDPDLEEFEYAGTQIISAEEYNQ